MSSSGLRLRPPIENDAVAFVAAHEALLQEDFEFGPAFDPSVPFADFIESWQTHVSRLSAVHSNGESVTDLAHSSIAQATDSIGKHTYGDTFDRIEIDRGSATNRIVAWLKNDFASQAADGGRTWGDPSSTESGNGYVT